MTAWESEIQQSIIDFNTLKAVLKLNDDEKELLYGEGQHVFKITPHLLSIMKNDDISGKVRKQFIPSVLYDGDLKFEDDYLCENSNEVCLSLIHI